jgi:SAM-dependent methyltransferase
MSDTDRAKWNARYHEGAYAERLHPTALLEEWLSRLPRGRALDVACGAGRNALFLAAAGYEVDAVDISREALERARRRAAAARSLRVHWLEADLETLALPDGPYDLIVMVRYVNRPLLPRLIERLAPGGHLLWEQHLLTAEPVAGPTDPRFRVAPGELPSAAGDLEVLMHREGSIVDPDGRRVALAQLVARRPADATAGVNTTVPGDR